MPVIQRLQNAMLEEKGSISGDDASPSAATDDRRHGSLGPLPLKGKSRSWLSASRLQENLKKAVNTPVARSKSMTVSAMKPDPPLDEALYNETREIRDSASLSFTAITESLSASSEDLSSALGRKFEQLLHSALSSSEDSSVPPPSEPAHSLSGSSSEDGVKGTRLWSTLFHQSGSQSHSKDDEDTHTTERSSTRSQGTAELIGQFLTTVSSSSSSKPITSSDSQHAAGLLSLLDGSTSEDDDVEGTDLALFDEESSGSSCSDLYSSDDCESTQTTQEGDDEIFGVAFNNFLTQLEGPCGAILARNNDGDTDSVTSEMLTEMPKSGQQRRGRSRSPRPYTPFGLEMEPSEEDEGADLEGQIPLDTTPDLGPAMNVFHSMFSCFASPAGSLAQNV
jgi:hypothetical protein